MSSNKCFKLNVYLRKHNTRISQSLKKFRCVECSLKLTSLAKIKAHKRICLGHKSCAKFNYNSKRPKALIQHKRLNLIKKSFECNQCEYKCSLSRNLKVHITSKKVRITLETFCLL